MRVLLTNIRLAGRTGSELYILDVARWLRDHGHEPVAYSARLGSLADGIRREAIAVVDDLDRLAEPPDVIHGQHHLATMTAIATFPDVPVVAYCHGWTPWEEMPVKHPSIRRYIAVSQHTRQRMTLESGIDPGLVSVLPNFVDIDLFPARPALAATPRRALIFSNYAERGAAWVNVIAAACAARGIELSVAGHAWGTAVDEPGEYLRGFDLVFAKARAAIEAMATGAGVVLCDATGVGPFVTPENFAALRDGNFGMRVLRQAHEPSVIAAAIDAYDAGSAGAVADLVRASLARDTIVPQVVKLYEEAIADSARQPGSAREDARAMAEYLRQLNNLNLLPSGEIRETFGKQLATAEQRLAVAEQRRQEAQASHEEQLNLLVQELASARRASEGGMRKFEEQLQAAVGERDRAQAELDRALAERDRAQAERDRAQAERDRAQAELDRAQAERDRAQAELDRALAERDRAQAERGRAQAELDRAQAERDRAQAERDRAQTEVEIMRNSTSWRYTAPLRSAGRVVRRLVHGRGDGSL